MGIIQDAKGKETSAAPRYLENVEATTLFAGYKEANDVYVPFSIYLKNDATITLRMVDDDADITVELAAGYHPLQVAFITTSDQALIACYPYKPRLA